MVNAVYILTCYIESHLLMIYQSFTTDLPILIFCDVANNLPIIYQSFQLITNDLLM